MNTEKNEILNNSTALKPKRKKVVIGIPGDNFSSKFLVSWSNLLASLWTSDKYEVAVAPGTGSFVTFVRMQTLGLDVKRGIKQMPFNGDNFDIWMTIDSDIIYTPENVMELLDATEKHPVVTGLYRMADLEHFAVVKDWDTKFFAKHGTFEFLTQDAVTKWKSETGLKYMPINYTGLGFFACRREVFTKLQYPFFNGDLKEVVADNGTVMQDISSEDVNFCQNIIKAGYPIVVNVDLRVGHLKPLVI